MNYDELIDFLNNPENPENEASKDVLKILHPPRLESIDQLEEIISSRFKYTGPGAWLKILKNHKSS